MSETVRYMLMSAGLNELSEEDIKFIESSPHPEAIISLLVQSKQESMKKMYTLIDIAKNFKLTLDTAKELKPDAPTH